MVDKIEYGYGQYVFADCKVLDIEYIESAGMPFAEYHCKTMDGKNIPLKFYPENIKPFWVQKGDIFGIDADNVYLVLGLEFKRATGLVVRCVLSKKGDMKQFLKDANKPRKHSIFSLDKLANFDMID